MFDQPNTLHRSWLRIVAIVVLIAALVLPVTVALAWSPSSLNPVDYTVELLQHYNVTTIQNLINVSEIEGRTYVGGNFVMSNAGTFGFSYSGATPTDDTIVVNGALGAGGDLHINRGSVYLSGTNSTGRTIDLQQAGSGAQLFQNQTIQPDLATLTTKVQLASAVFSAVPSGSNTVTINGQTLQFNVNSVGTCGIAVFSTNLTALFNSGTVSSADIAFNIPTAQVKGILINLTDTGTVTIPGGLNWNNEFADDSWRAKILWNMPTVTALNDGGHGWQGSLLAYNADVTASNPLNGQSVLKSLNNSSEAHNYPIASDLKCLPTTAATVTLFKGSSVKQGIRMRWETSMERGVIGYNILRAKKKNGNYQPINAELIPAQNVGGVGSQQYQFTDKKTVKGKKYWYKLQVVNVDGTTTDGPRGIKRK